MVRPRFKRVWDSWDWWESWVSLSLAKPKRRSGRRLLIGGVDTYWEPTELHIFELFNSGESQMTHMPHNLHSSSDQFEKSANYASSGMIAEFLRFLGHNKKLWLIPVIVILLLMGILVVLGGTAAAPFIYTLF